MRSRRQFVAILIRTVLSVLCAGASFVAYPSDPNLLKVGVIGERDERLTGNFEQLQQTNPDDAIRHLSRALRISFPMRGALAVTGTPVCYPDVVLTVAHIVKLHGDATAAPRGLRVSVPDLKNPGNFTEGRIVTDYMLAGARRQYNPGRVPSVADDFMLLQLNADLPRAVEPLALPPLPVDNPNAMPVCKQPTVNVAYHDSLGVNQGRVVVNERNAGKVPLLTRSIRPIARDEDPALFGRWYENPRIAFTGHDTETSASGSAIICPATSGTSTPASQRDTLQAIVIGQTVAKIATKATVKPGTRAPGQPRMYNVVTTNINGIYKALARLKNISVAQLASVCSIP